MGLWDIIFGAIEELTTGTRIPDSGPMNLGPIGVYEGPATECGSCGSKDITPFGGWEDGNVKTEGYTCHVCGHEESHAIA